MAETKTKKYTSSVGRRKTAIAKVKVFEKGKGEITINKKTLEEYFPVFELQETVKKSLVLTGFDNKVDVEVTVSGGGKRGQADAVSHGISRSIEKINHDLKKTLKVAKLLTRDPRRKERKKPGLKRARRAPQWSKR